ncbi:MAG TPA: methyltransferase domain-containing protein [Microlunatus sp.]|nr:methyltransferase domain-containing protein [Microlunatus sp.]
MSAAEDSMSAEFDTVAEWTAEVGLDLDPAYRIPAGCRGSGSPGTLHWFLDQLAPRRGETFLDCGAGVGGPAAFAARETGVRPILTDPEAGACRAARSLFALPAVQAVGRLPIRSGSVRTGWSLGVLCTVDDQPGFLAELRRVLQPEGRFGLLVYAAAHDGPLHAPAPEGNTFPTEEGLGRLVRSAGLRVEASGRTDDFATLPADWQQAVAALDSELHRRHGSDPRWQTAEEQSSRMGGLLASGEVIGVLQVLRPR